MALIIFLYKVSNIDLPKPPSDFFIENRSETTEVINEESPPLLCVKATFRGNSLWSNNVPICDGTASFLAHEDKGNKFHFNLTTVLVPDDKLRLEFYMIKQENDQKTLLAFFELMLDLLVDKKPVDLLEENLSHPNNYSIKTTVQLKLYNTSLDTEREAALDAAGEEVETIDCNSTFHQEDQHVHSEYNDELQKLRRKSVDRQDDVNADSQNDSDFLDPDDEETIEAMSKEEKLIVQERNLELLEKGLGRYEGDIYQMKQWQIMVHVIQGRHLVGFDINPYVCVQIDDQRRFTGVHRCTNSPSFREFFTFDFTLPATQIMEKVICFKVHNQQKFVSVFTHTKPIGIFKVDIATVYNEREHTFERKWAQIVNPDAIEVTCGHLLLSVAIAERGVSTKNILGEISGEDDDIENPSKKFISSGMPRSLFPVQMKITFYAAAELPEMMTKFLTNVSKRFFSLNWDPIDSYVEVSYNTIRAQTSHENGVSPMWREAFYLIGQFPPLVRTMKISVKDHSTVEKDRTIASFLIDLFKISETNPAIGFLPTFGPTWVFLYGSPREYTINKDQDGLGEGMGEGVSYKGRLLLEIECHPASGHHTANTNIQKQKGLQLPDASQFPLKHVFLLFGCIFDVTMIDKEFGSSTICFELSIGPSGYTNPDDLNKNKPSTSLTPPYVRFPVANNQRHFRLPIDSNKPILFTKYRFYDYTYRMTISNRLKRASEHMTTLIREFELQINAKASEDELKKFYGKMEQYIHTLPCGCAEPTTDSRDTSAGGAIHPTLSELLNSPRPMLRMNTLDEKRQKKIVHSLEALKGWISSEIAFDEEKRFEIIKQLHKIARVLKQLAVDAQPALPDIFLWMICDTKRVAYARLSPEDLLHNSCIGERGLQNGRVQTLFLRRPQTADKIIKSSSTNAKVQIYLWLGTEEQEAKIFKRLPEGFDMPPLPLSIDHKHIHYAGSKLYEIRCHCCKARLLIASDDTGLSDPFISITAGNETQTTPVLKESLCPQWDTTLVFRHLMHVGTRETAEEIIGNVVVECYDYDDSADGPKLLGRFSITAKLDLFLGDKNHQEKTLQWYEFKLGEKRAGELLAVFELIELNEGADEGQSIYELEELKNSSSNFPPDKCVMKLVKNKLYRLPDEIIPDSKPYEIEVLFWGLRELRAINLQSIQQAEVSVEFAGGRLKRTIRDVQKFPNFEYSAKEFEESKFIIRLPDDHTLWPHLSISCIQNRLFGMKEIVGNLVVVDLQKYLDKPTVPLTITNGTDANKDNTSKPVTYDFSRVRRSIDDAYDAVVVDKDRKAAKTRLLDFDKIFSLQKSNGDSKKELIPAEVLSDETEKEADEKTEEEKAKDASNKNVTIELITLDPPTLTIEQKKQLANMERTASWWTKYYASRAKLKLQKKTKIDLDDKMQDYHKLYTDFFEDEEQIKELTKKSAIDESLENFETDRLQELSLLQTFDFLETELEKVESYDGFNDILDKFPLYKGKGTRRSDEIGDENRGKLRIRELNIYNTSRKSLAAIDRHARTSSLTAFTTNQVTTDEPIGSTALTHKHLAKFDFNQNNITLKCRLYVIKAVLFRSWDRSGKADPYLKICLNNDTIIDDVKSKIYNSLEPVFGKSYEFEITIPRQSILRIQVRNWSFGTANDKIAETSIDVENRWLSAHRGTCGLPKRYDSAGYNIWRDTKKPEQILKDLCQRTGFNPPLYNDNYTAVAVGDHRFECDSECVTFINTKRVDLSYRKGPHESSEDYLRQNTALAALHAWGTKIHTNEALVAEHIECRSLYNPDTPDIEQGKLEMWLDIFPMSRPPTTAPIDITPPKAKSYQLRLTILNTSDVTLDDENLLTGESSSDIYVKAWIKGENEDPQQTDVHYRSLTGVGNFNWRLIYDFNYIDIEEKIVFEEKNSLFQIGSSEKKIPPRIVIRVYDADLISADDFLGECIFDLTHLPIGAKSSDKCNQNIVLDAQQSFINLFVNKRIVGWWPLIAPLKYGEIRDNVCLGGKLQAEFALITAEQAEQNPVGRGREAPCPLDAPMRSRRKKNKTKVVYGTETDDSETEQTSLSLSYSKSLTSTPSPAVNKFSQQSQNLQMQISTGSSVEIPLKSNEINTYISQQSNPAIRLSDNTEAPIRMLPPIKGFENLDLVSLEKATEPLISIVPDMAQMVYMAKEDCSNPEEGLSLDESASIRLYTMEWSLRDKSFYFILNETLRSEKRQLLTPWFLYLRLFMHSLLKLPSVTGTHIFRGIKKDLSSDYPKGKKFVWWPFSSCTRSVGVLENESFFGKSGTRTLFSIDCNTGKDIRKHSSFTTEDEVLLIAARQFEVVSSLDTGNGLHMIQIKEIQPPFPLISYSPTIPSTTVNANSD